MGDNLRILYGEVFQLITAVFHERGDIDGVLVGGSSLNVSEFEKIVRSAAQLKSDIRPSVSCYEY